MKQISPSPWQLAVVEWDQYRKTLDTTRKIDASIEEFIDEVEAEANQNNSKYLKNGDIVYISSIYMKTIHHGDEKKDVPIAIVWSPSRKMYLSQILFALHPIVSESDALCMDVKFGIGRDNLVGEGNLG